MQVLLIRHDDDNTMHWHTYDDTTILRMFADIRAHLNTMGVVRIELIPSHLRDIRELNIRKIPLKD